MTLFFYQSHGHLKNHPCLLKKEKNYIKMEIRCNVFPAIAIAITTLTNKCRTKNSLLWWKSWWCCDISGIRVKILQELNVRRHRDFKTERPRHRESETKKPQYRVSVESWPLYPLLLRSVLQRLKVLNKHFPLA